MLLMDPPGGNGKWQLYNLENDPTEQVDLSSLEPERLNRMIELWNLYERENNLIHPVGGIVF